MKVIKKKEHLEETLDKYLKEICKKVNITLAEWDLNKDLYKALQGTPDLTKAKTWCIKYDSLIEYANDAQIKIHPKYYWFENLIKDKEEIE